MDTVPNDLVTIAVLQSDTEANLIKNQLEAAGIKAYLYGEEAVAMVWHLAGAFGGIKLQVATGDAEDAISILERKPWQNQATVASAETLENIQEEEDEIFSQREQTANRAVRAAVFGLLFWPLEIYALWLLLQVYFSPEKLEGRSRVNATVGSWITLTVLLGFCLAAAMFIRGPVERSIDLRELPHPQVLVGRWEGIELSEKGKIHIAMQLQKDGTIHLRESGAADRECQGTWAYKNQAIWVNFDRYLKGDDSSKGKLMRYDVEDFKESEMTLVSAGPQRVRMVSVK